MQYKILLISRACTRNHSKQSFKRDSLAYYHLIWVLVNHATTFDHLRPPKTIHNFATTTHDWPYFHLHYLRPPTTRDLFTATNHNHPRPTIIKLPEPKNNDSLATTLLTMRNSELNFCHHFSLIRIPRAV